MVKAQDDSNEQTRDDDEQRLAQLVDEEGDKIRKQAEHESAHIVARAREEYKGNLVRFLKEEREKISRQAEREAEEVIAKAVEEKKRIIAEAKAEARSQAEQVIKEVKRIAEEGASKYTEESKRKAEQMAEQISAKAREKAEKEASAIIDQANAQATDIIAKALERAKKEAEEEKLREAERIIQNARQESDQVIAAARKAAEAEANRTIADALKRAEETASKIITLAREEARLVTEATGKQSDENGKKLSVATDEGEQTSDWAELIAEATEKARQILNDSNSRANQPEPADAAAGEKDQSPPGAARPSLRGAVEIVSTVKQDPESEPRKADSEIEDKQPGKQTASIATYKEPKAITENYQPNLERGKAEPTEKERPADVKVAESKKYPLAADQLERGEVEIVLGAVTPLILTKLHLYLKYNPDITLISSSDFNESGTCIVVGLEKPVPLVKELRSRIPEAEITGDQSGLNGNGKKRKIHIARQRTP